MRTSKEGLRLITQREGKILHVYKDSKGLPTAGVGHLLSAAERRQFPVGTPITEKQCQDWLADDLGECEDVINGLGVDLAQNEFDALASLAFNIGVGNVRTGKGGFIGSTVVRRLKAGDHKAAAEAILRWDKPKEIIGRRRGEYHQFKTAYKGSAAADESSVDREGVGAPLPPVQSATQQQTAESITNVVQQGDKTVPDNFKPENKVVNAPAAEGSTAKSAGMTIAGFAVPAFLVGLIRAVQDAIANGYVDAKDVGNAVVGFIQGHTKYVFIGAFLIVAGMMLKKLYKQVTLWLQMYIAARADMHNVTVRPH